MNTRLILGFLKKIAANNNRPWFAEHKNEYELVRADFEAGIRQAIVALSTIDEEVAHLEVKDCTYRFYRDTRFSADKSPYKRHMGAFINSHGKKSLRGGYYLHLEPGNCVIAIGSYWLPTNILTSCRNEIMANIGTWRKTVESKQFLDMFGKPNQGIWDDKASEQGFGLSGLKTIPKGFPKDYEYKEYLRMKDYCCWVKIDDSFFASPDWTNRMLDIAKVGKPMMDFVNSVIDDYE